MKKRFLTMNLQFFAGDGTGSGEGSGDGKEGTQNNQNNNNQTTQQAFDYDKLASIISGKQSVAEDTVLKNYFKQQGLSQDEMTQAINQYKTQKAQNTPDVAAIQTELAQAKNEAREAMIEKEATLQAITLGLDSKTIPYVLKLADLSKVAGEDGKVNAEELKNALNKVLEDVPQLKPSQQQNNTGFQIGNTGQQQNNNANEDQLKAAFGL